MNLKKLCWINLIYHLLKDKKDSILDDFKDEKKKKINIIIKYIKYKFIINFINIIN